jgi:hypothetical protein
MRIIGYLDRPGMVVTVFKNDGKISVKFETNLLEQIFKIREDIYLNDLTEIDKLFDLEWSNEIVENFNKMSKDRYLAVERYNQNFQKNNEPDII